MPRRAFPAVALDRRASRVRRSRAAVVVAALAATIALWGCGASGVNKEATTTPARRITLTIVIPDGTTPDTTYFINQVARRTHDQLRLVVNPAYSTVEPRNELRLAVALRDRKVQMAYLPTRAWELDGRRVLDFRALQAPFLITSYPLLRAVTTGPIAAQMLAGLGRNGLVGLGLVPTELRRALGRRPLVSLSAFRGARIRIVNSPTSALIVRALGAIPVSSLTPDQVSADLTDGRLDGTESDPLNIANNAYTEAAPYLPSNIALFPKVQTLVMTRKTYDGLDPADRAALKASAAATVAHANPAAEDQLEMQSLCGSGVHLVAATPGQLAALQRATTSVYTNLDKDPSTMRAILEIQQLKERISVRNSTLAPCPATRTPSTSTASPAFPTGKFESVITRAEVAQAGLPLQDAHTDEFIFKNGKWTELWFDPTNASQPRAGGPYAVKGDALTLGPGTLNYRLKWSYFGGLLTFKIIDVPDSLGDFLFTVNPWRKVG